MSIALFCVAGPLATIMNRRTLLASAVPIPITISAVGMAVTALASRVALRARPGLATHNVAAPDYLRVCLPIGAAAAMSLALGLQAYLYLSISFVQMLKAFTPVIVLVVTVARRLRKLTPRLLVAVLSMAAGVVLAASGEGSFNALGVTVMLSSEVAEAVRCVLTENLLRKQRLGVLGTMQHIAPACATCLCAAALVFELPGVCRAGAASITGPLLANLAASALLSIVVNFAVFAAIEATSSLTVKLLSPLRNSALIFFGVFFHGEAVSALELVGYIVALVSFAAYTQLGGDGRRVGRGEGSAVRARKPPSLRKLASDAV